MGLMDILNQCITAGHEMTKAIAIAQFNDDSPEARKITRRWRIGEAADLVGVSSQAIMWAAGFITQPVMAIITVILSVLILTMTVLLGDRRVKNELIRRFHL